MANAYQQAMGYWMRSGAGSPPLVVYFESGSGNWYLIGVPDLLSRFLK